jgi:DNA polymerase-3 subunit gamma/tau
MDTFIVSARKYRPQNFGTVVGQNHITTTLKNAILSNQLAHAFLFCGPRGVGKTTCARILAKTINCEKISKDGEACNKCTSCKSFDSGTSFNIHELDAASNNSVDDIRTLTEQVRFAPQAGKYKVYIVDEVHMLSAAAFNAFLKTLEEPPPFVIFILATTEKHKILPTILSRCQIFDFKRITNADTAGHLEEICNKEGIKAEKTALHMIAQKSEGCLRDALSILDKIVSFTGGKITYSNTLEHLNILDEDYYFRLIDMMMSQKAAEALLVFDEINQKGFEGDILLEGLSETVRNILVSTDSRSVSLLETAEEFKSKYKEAAQTIPSSWLLAALNILSEASIQFKQARNKRLFMELVLIKLAYLHQAIELVSGPEGPAKKKLTDSSKTMAFRSLVAVSVKETPPSQSARLIIENDEQPVRSSTPKEIPVISETAENAAYITKLAAVSSIAVTPAPEATIGKLSKLKEKIIARERELAGTTIDLSDDNLKEAWNQYIQKLEENKNLTSVSYFRLATLRPVDQNQFEIAVTGDFHKKFIEAERADLIEHLRDFFKNTLLSYSFLVAESEEGEEKDKPLSSKEHFSVFSEKYPKVKVLKERLKLEIDL